MRGWWDPSQCRGRIGGDHARGDLREGGSLGLGLTGLTGLTPSE